jgi:hypothetical protein
VFDGLRRVTKETRVVDAGALEVWWGGQLIGALTDLELETVDLFRSYKILGRWIPVHGAGEQAFLQALAAAGRVEVTVDVSPVLGRGFGTGLQVMFSLASADQAWLYANDLEGHERLARPIETANEPKQS